MLDTLKTQPLNILNTCQNNTADLASFQIPNRLKSMQRLD